MVSIDGYEDYEVITDYFFQKKNSSNILYDLDLVSATFKFLNEVKRSILSEQRFGRVIISSTIW